MRFLRASPHFIFLSAASRSCQGHIPGALSSARHHTYITISARTSFYRHSRHVISTADAYARGLLGQSLIYLSLPCRLMMSSQKPFFYYSLTYYFQCPFENELQPTHHAAICRRCLNYFRFVLLFRNFIYILKTCTAFATYLIPLLMIHGRLMQVLTNLESASRLLYAGKCAMRDARAIADAPRPGL